MYGQQLQSMRKDLEKSRELEQKAMQELTECMLQMQMERESQEKMMRRLKQQHQEEVDELNARVRSAEDTERRWEASNQAVLLQKEEEKKHLLEKLEDALQEVGTWQVSAWKYTWSDLHSYNVRKLIDPFQLWPTIATSCAYVLYLCSVYIYSPIHIIHTFRPQLMSLEARLQLYKQCLQKQEKRILQGKNMKQNWLLNFRYIGALLVVVHSNSPTASQLYSYRCLCILYMRRYHL